MKKILALVLALIMILSLAACGDKEEAASDNKAEEKTDEKAEEKAVTSDPGYIFKSGSTEICINADVEDVVAEIGDPQAYFEAESCAFEGIDKTYTYNGFEITTYPSGDGKDRIYTIIFTNDAVQTAEGIYIGSSADDVVNAYGEKSADGQYKYDKGDCSLIFIMDGDAVKQITYLAKNTL